MNHLFFDTSNEFLNVVVLKDQEILASSTYKAWQRQSEFLIPEIKKVLEKAGKTMKDIQHVCCGIGPGSYTGVRIALTVAKVFGTVCSMKVSTVSSLAIMGRKDSSYVAVMDARSNRSYITIYQNGETILKDQILPNDRVLQIVEQYEAKDFEIRGDGKYLNIDTLPADYVGGLATYGWKEPEKNVLTLKPVYLRDDV